jgi:hypothetical protein
MHDLLRTVCTVLFRLRLINRYLPDQGNGTHPSAMMEADLALLLRNITINIEMISLNEFNLRLFYEYEEIILLQHHPRH